MYEGAGIYRHTWLVKRSPLHIITDGVFANPVKKEGEQWEIPVEVSLYNAGGQSADGEVEVTLISPNGKQVQTQLKTVSVVALRDRIVNLSLPVSNPQLWSPDNPVLYKV